MAQRQSDKTASSTNSTGVLLGLACGDALGRPVESESPEAIQREYGTITEMLGDGVHQKPAGTVTDDTDLALCIARSLHERREFDPADIAERFVEWYNANPFSIGQTTQWALYDLSTGFAWDEAGKRAWEGNNAGNGSVMRCAPLAVAYQDDHEALVEVSIQSSVITHYDPHCVYGCAALNLTLAELLDGATDPLERTLDTLVGRAPVEVIEALSPICDATPGSPIEAERLDPSSYVLDTLRAALSHALAAESAEEGIVAAVNGGGDADTIGAITGALVGARFGTDGLPERWLAEVDETKPLTRLSHSLAEGPLGTTAASDDYQYDPPEDSG